MNQRLRFRGGPENRNGFYLFSSFVLFFSLPGVSSSRGRWKYMNIAIFSFLRIYSDDDNDLRLIYPSLKLKQ